MTQLTEIIQRVDELKAKIDGLRPLDGEQEQRVLQKFRLDWNYHSNAIEGNTLTYGETRAFLLHGVTAQGKPFRDYLDIIGQKLIHALELFLRGAQGEDIDRLTDWNERVARLQKQLNEK